jgi:hypothetical protein
LKPPLKRTLSFGILCAPVGIGVGVYIRMSSIGDYSEFPYYSGAAAFIAPAIIWHLMIERKKKIGIGRGASAGVLGAALAHFVCWYLSILTAEIQYWIIGRQVGSLPGPPMNPFEGLVGAFTLSLFSFLFVGWLTLPLGGLLGGVCGKLFSEAVTRENLNHAPTAGNT